MYTRVLAFFLLVGELVAEVPIQDLSIFRWSEEPFQYLGNNGELVDAPNNFISGNHQMQQERTIEVVKRVMNPEEASMQRHLITRSLCSCETEYDIRDLGEGYYPRYLTASRCKPKVCQNKFNSCRLLYYRVHILKQRDTNHMSEEDYNNGNDLSDSPLPESLRRKWQFQQMSVAVACVPNLDNRRN